ncbi:MAG: hypothetical protein IKU24_05370 [Clostridia bacterium]|nr:hypothetical protein [Clostridia bacterium]
MTKQKLNFLFPILLLFLCLAFPSVCASGAKNGLAISLKMAFPALFPSLILSGMITQTLPFQKRNSAVWIPFILGILCGFPVGAKAVCDLYQKGHLSRKDSENMLFFCNNAGPAFLICFVGQGLFFDTKKGVFLFLMQSAISLICFLCFLGKRKLKKEKDGEKISLSTSSYFLVFRNALVDAANSFIYITSCIVFFSFFANLILHLFPLTEKWASFIVLFLEMTNGIEKTANAFSSLALPLCALGCGWAGVSVHLQTIGPISESGLAMKKYLLGKLFFALMMFLGALFFQKLL